MLRRGGDAREGRGCSGGEGMLRRGGAAREGWNWAHNLTDSVCELTKLLRCLSGCHAQL